MLNVLPVGFWLFWQGEILPENYTWYGMGQEVLRSEYPELYNHVEKYKMITTEENWQAGMQGLYSYGDGQTTFRFPLIVDGGVLSFADGVTTLAGQKIDEELPNIKAYADFVDDIGISSTSGGFSPSLWGNRDLSTNRYVGAYNALGLNASLSNPVYKDGGHVKQNGIAARLIIKYK